MLAGPRMSGCNSAVAPPVVPGGVDRAELAAAELAQTEAALQQRCLDAGVPYLAPGAPGYSMELDSRASAKQRGLARRQRHDKLRKAIDRAGRGSMVRCSVDTLRFSGWFLAVASRAMASG